MGKTLTTIYTSRWLAPMGRKVVINDLDPQRGIWDFAEALGRPDGRILKHLAVVDPDGSPPFEPDYGLVDTPPALDVSLPAMNTADWLLIPVIPDHQPVVQLAKFLERLPRPDTNARSRACSASCPSMCGAGPSTRQCCATSSRLPPSMIWRSLIRSRTRGPCCATRSRGAYGAKLPRR